MLSAVIGRPAMTRNIALGFAAFATTALILAASGAAFGFNLIG